MDIQKVCENFFIPALRDRSEAGMKYGYNPYRSSIRVKSPA